MINLQIILMTALFGLFISIISFTIKAASKKTHSISFTLNRYVLIGLILLIYIIYDNGKEVKTSNIIKDIYKVKYEIIFASIITIMTAILEAYLIEKNDVSYVIPLSIAWALLFVGLIGKFVFNEIISYKRCFGYIIIGIGLIIIATS
jgi:drug/metabolite transporter (DMT)-like permease